jgi:hypothetical protein
VANPTWSTCRWVKTTVSISSGGTPARRRVANQSSSRSVKSGLGRFFPLPTPASTRTVRVGVRIRKPPMSITRKPSSRYGGRQYQASSSIVGISRSGKNRSGWTR